MELTEEEFIDKKIQIVCAVVPAIIHKYEKEIDNDSHRKTIAFQAVAMAEKILHEIGFEADQ